MISSIEDRIIVHLPLTESTNDVATGLSRGETEAGSIILADCQSAGRGRHGKIWESPLGTGLYFSMILRPDLHPAELPKISLVAGYAASLAIERICNIQPGLKWPNDLMLEGKKFGGILAENIPSESPLVILGIGLNLNTPLSAFPPPLNQSATSLFAYIGEKFSRRTVLGAIVDQLDILMLRLEQGRFSEIIAGWMDRDILKGKELTWLSPAGKKVTGISLSPDQNGLLHIRDREGKVHEVMSGDLSLRGSIKNHDVQVRASPYPL